MQYRETHCVYIYIYNTNTKHCKHVYTVQCNFTFIPSTNAHTHTHLAHILLHMFVCIYPTRTVLSFVYLTLTYTHIHSAHVSHTKYISFIHPTNMSLTLIKYLRKFHVCFMFSCMCIYIYIPGQSLSRIIFDLCGFSGAGLTITFRLRVMDSMTQCWCQKVDLSRLFCVILRIFALYLWFFQM